MSKTVSNFDGANTTLTDEEWFASNPSATPAQVFAFGKATLKTKRNDIQNRSLLWIPGGLPVDASDGGLEALDRKVQQLYRIQVGFRNFALDQASFTGVVADGVLTSSSVTGLIHEGVLLNGAGVAANTLINYQLTGEPRGAGTYQLSIDQDVPSAAMTTSHYHEGLWVPGDGTPLDMEDEDGAPVGNEEDGWGVHADNLMDMANDAARYVREVWIRWRILYNDLVAALATVGTDQNKIDAMKVVIDDFDDPANWPGVNIPL